MGSLLVRGDILYCKDGKGLQVHEDAWMQVERGVVTSIAHQKPAIWQGELKDFRNKLILPVFTDLHLHASQYCTRGLGLNQELLPWLANCTFREESKFSDEDYARAVFQALLNELWQVGSVNLAIWVSLHWRASLQLMHMLEESGFRAYVGKVNMDRNSPAELMENTEDSLLDTKTWVEASRDFKGVKPILTPRFAPACSEELLRKLGHLAVQENLPVQSHLNENQGEIRWVSELFPHYEHYYDVYRKNGLTPKGKTIMAHCIDNLPEELRQMKEDRVFVVHCPLSNVNLKSGIMPLRKLLDEGFQIGLGSDIGAGDRLFMGASIVEAVRLSKLYSLYHDEIGAVSSLEAYYLATCGGGAFFGKYGSLEPGYSADFLVVDDSSIYGNASLEVHQRLERFLYLGGAEHIVERYVKGKPWEKPYRD